ncbi:MAG: glycosyltransferase family 4 protein [Chitinispirillaceae bacterium]|nr:glycosyltransferase family 4 protein [Chitinispirillaceae bacterium]
MCGNKKTILFINHWAKELGGAEYSLLDILEEIAKSKKAEIYLLTSEEGLLHKKLEGKNINYKIIPCSKNVIKIRRTSLFISILREWQAMFSFFLFLVKTYLFVSKLKPVCIHANVPKSHITLFFLCLMGYKGKTIIHMREIFEKNSLAYFIYFFFSFVKNLEIIAVSKSVKFHLPSLLQKKTEVIYNGVTISPKKKISFTDYPVKFLYLGRIVRWKRCDILIVAFVRVVKKKRKSSAYLTIAGNLSYGDKNYIDYLTNLIHQNNAEDLIRFNFNIENPLEVLCSHDVMCVPSAKEPFGRVAAEAQGCGLPVIGFKEGGLPEIVIDGETGIVVEEGNLDKLGDAIGYFIDNPHQISLMGERGRVRAIEMFNKEKQIPLIVDKILSS